MKRENVLHLALLQLSKEIIYTGEVKRCILRYRWGSNRKV